MKERKTRVNRNKVKIGLDTCEFEMALTGRNMKDLQQYDLPVDCIMTIHDFKLACG